MTDTLQQIFNTAEDPMALILNDLIAKVNPAFCTISGFKEQEIIGKPFMRYIVDQPKVAETYLDRIKGGKAPLSYETQVAAREGLYTVTICGTRVTIDGEVGVFVILRVIK